ncbi:hypothetical protein OG357_25190 [Streptomyces sp. NBC_01255]|uniref:hypothetical protein n=1 Tax=Streptomyces sp. NBC_01255 TaxID=2903798 RepID=UPI002E324013|nr:hypothetical protein [Streptomyces sp. NBC_01255]
MTDQRHVEEEQVQHLLAAAAELPGTPATPGADFTAHARRRLARRRLGVGAGVAAVLIATAVGAPAVLRGMAGQEEQFPAASAQCLQSTVRNLQDGKQAGFRAVYGELRAGGIAMDDGITEGSAFRFEIDGALTDGDGVPSSGSALTWYPVSETHLPRPGRYVLLLAQAERPAEDGRPLFEFRPEEALPLGTDGRVRLTCEDGSEGSVEMERLRAAVTGPQSAARNGHP